MKECRYCNEEFDETKGHFQVIDDYAIDEDGDEKHSVVELFLCPHCESWTE